MSNATAVAQSPPFITAVRAAANNRKPPPSQVPMKKQSDKPQKTTTAPGFGGKKKDPVWQCVQNCGARAPHFHLLKKSLTTLLISRSKFQLNFAHQLFNSLVGPDGWCNHYEKSSRRCSIYAERPYFCRVEPEVFDTLYGIDKKRFNKEACSCCIDTIKAVYGADSKELENFNHAIWSSNSK